MREFSLCDRKWFLIHHSFSSVLEVFASKLKLPFNRLSTFYLTLVLCIFYYFVQ